MKFKELFISKLPNKSPESFESVLEIRRKQCHNNSSFSFIQNIQSLLKIYPTIHLFGHITTVKQHLLFISWFERSNENSIQNIWNSWKSTVSILSFQNNLNQFKSTSFTLSHHKPSSPLLYSHNWYVQLQILF